MACATSTIAMQAASRAMPYSVRATNLGGASGEESGREGRRDGTVVQDMGSHVRGKMGRVAVDKIVARQG